MSARVLARLPVGCIAECVLSPRGCPVACGAIVLRLPDGSFSPAVDTGAPTIVSREWNGAALFDVLASDLTPDDWTLWHANERPRTGDGTTYGRRTLAGIIDRAHRLAQQAAAASADLARARAEVGVE